MQILSKRFYAQQKLPAEIPFGTVIFVPNSEFARSLIKTGAMWPLGRAYYNPDIHTLIDVPKTESYSEPKPEPKKKAPAKKKATPKKKKDVKKGGSNNKSDS